MQVTEQDAKRIRQLTVTVRPYVPTQVTGEELYVAGLQGLWEAHEKYNPRKGTWAKYSYTLIRGRMMDYVRGWMPGNRGRSRGAPALFPVSYDLENSSGGTMADDLEDPRQPIDEVEMTENLEQIMLGLSGEERFIVKCCLVHEIEQATIAKAVGIHSSRISQILRDLKIRMRINATRMLQLPKKTPSTSTNPHDRGGAGVSCTQVAGDRSHG